MSMEIIFYDHKNRMRKFSPARDIAWYWPWIFANVAPWLSYERWDDNIKQLMDRANLSENDLMLAFVHMVQFMERALDPGVSNPKEALDAVRFFECPPEAITALMYRVGISAVGAWFDGVRRVTPAGEIPEEVANLVKAAEEFLQTMNKQYPIKEDTPESGLSEPDKTPKSENENSTNNEEVKDAK